MAANERHISHQSSVLGIVANARLAGLSRFIHPNPTALKRWTIQVHRHCGMRPRVSNFMQALRIFYKNCTTVFVKYFVARTHQLLGVLLVPTLLNLTLQDAHPTTVARMIVNGGFLTWVPAQQQQRITNMVCGNQVACVVTTCIDVSVCLPVLWRQFQVSVNGVRWG